MLTRSILSSLLLLVPTGCLLAGNEKDYTYLALGDSIAFGFDPTLFSPTPSAAGARSIYGLPGGRGRGRAPAAIEKRGQCSVSRGDQREFLDLRRAGQRLQWYRAPRATSVQDEHRSAHELLRHAV